MADIIPIRRGIDLRKFFIGGYEIPVSFPYEDDIALMAGEPSWRDLAEHNIRTAENLAKQLGIANRDLHLAKNTIANMRAEAIANEAKYLELKSRMALLSARNRELESRDVTLTELILTLFKRKRVDPASRHYTKRGK